MAQALRGHDTPLAHQLLLLRVPSPEAATTATPVLRSCGLSEARVREALSPGWDPPLLILETEDLARVRDLGARASAAGLDVAVVIDDPTPIEKLQRWWARLNPAPKAASPVQPRPPASEPTRTPSAESLTPAAAAEGLRARWRDLGLGPRLWLAGGLSIGLLALVLGGGAWLYADDLPLERLRHAGEPPGPGQVDAPMAGPEAGAAQTLRVELAEGGGAGGGSTDLLAGGGAGGAGGAAALEPAEGGPTSIELVAGTAGGVGAGGQGAAARPVADSRATVEREVQRHGASDLPGFFAMLCGIGVGAGIGRKVGLAGARGSTTARLRTGLLVLAVAVLTSIGAVTAGWLATGSGGADPDAGTFKRFVESHRSHSACGRELAPFARLACQAREMKAAPAPAPPASQAAAAEGAPAAGDPLASEGATSSEGAEASQAAPASEGATPSDGATPAEGATPSEGATATDNPAAADGATAPPQAPSAQPGPTPPTAPAAPEPPGAPGALPDAVADPEQAGRAGLVGLLGLLGGLVLSTFFHLFLRGARQ